MISVGLSAPGLEQPQALAAIQQPLEQQSLRTAVEEAGAELAEHGGVEPRVGQLQAEQVLPVDAGADGLRRRTVGEVLAELQDGDQGQPPGREGGLSAAGIQVGEVGVVEDGAELVAELQVGVTPGEGGVGDAGGVLGDGRDESERKGHGATSRRAGAKWCKLLQYMPLPARREFASSITLRDGHGYNEESTFVQTHLDLIDIVEFGRPGLAESEGAGRRARAAAGIGRTA